MIFGVERVANIVLDCKIDIDSMIKLWPGEVYMYKETLK